MNKNKQASISTEGHKTEEEMVAIAKDWVKRAGYEYISTIAYNHNANAKNTGITVEVCKS